jgi:sn-glycerol 3-phosphate transport system substrate-binding protein
MRRFSTQAAVGVLIALALVAAACGGDSGESGSPDDSTPGGADLPECPLPSLETADGPVEITVWHTLIATGLQAFEEVVDQYNASQDVVVVQPENQGTSFEEIQRKYNQGIQSGDLPTAALLEDTQTLALADSGTILPAQACAGEGYDSADLVPTIVDYYSIDGVQYPTSMTPSNALLYYNRDHFEQAGLDPDAPPQTLEEVRDAAEAIKEAGVSDTPLALYMAPWIFEFWLTGAGIPFVDNDNGRGDGETTEAVFDDERVLELLEFFKGMEEDGLLQPFPYREGDIDHYLVLANPDAGARASMEVEASSAATAVESFLKGELDPSELSDDARVVVTDDLDLSLNMDAAEIPGIDAPGRVQVGGGVVYVTNAGTPEEQAAAIDFSNYLNQPDTQATLSLVGGSDPINTGTEALPEVQETWDTTLSGGWLAISYDQMVNGIDPEFPGPLVGPYTEMREAIATMLEAVMLNDVDPQQALTTAEDEVTAALERYQDQNF